MITNLTLRQLRYALAVAETGHFGRAADRCSVTQPALSQQIKQLEALCGALLFDRMPRAVVPTPFGREFLDRARRLVQAADDLGAFAFGEAGIPARPLRFGLIPTVAPYLLPEIFPALQRDLPALLFTVSERRTESLVEGLIDGSLDLALIASEPPRDGPSLTGEALFDDPFVFASSETGAGPIPLADLPRDRILLLDEGHCFRDQTIAACRLDAENAPRTFAATSLSTIVEFVANGQGVTLLPQISLRKEATDPRIHLRPLESPGASRLLRLIWRSATPYAKTYAAIAQTIRHAHLGDEEAA